MTLATKHKRITVLVAFIIIVLSLQGAGFAALARDTTSSLVQRGYPPVLSLQIKATSAVTPTNEWVNFYSQSSTLNGQPVPVGAVVKAYNPRGVECGEFAVIDPGFYGLMPVYRDDPNTPEDEGMLPGEEVTFTINDIPARPQGPDDTMWDTNGSVKQVDLVASVVTPTNEWVSFYSQNTILEGQPVPLGAVVRAYNPRGIQCGEFVVNHAGWYGSMPVYRDDPETPEDEGMLPGEEVSFTIDDIPARVLGPDGAIWTTNGDLKEVDLTASLDITAPVISNISASDISGTGATISWTTDENATSQVEYGTTTAYGSFTTFDPSLVTRHTVTLSGLTGSTTYHYRVQSKDAAANLAFSENHTFMTADITPPDTQITDGPEGTVATTTVTFAWTGSDDLSDVSNLVYSYNIDWSAWSPYSSTTTAQFMGLSEGGHTFSVRANDEAGNVDPTPATRSFTVDTSPPVISGVDAQDIHSTGATIVWSTNEPSDSQVEYGLTSTYGYTTTLDTTLTVDHSVVITGLTMLTTYHYRVRSADSVGNLAMSGDYTFTTYDTSPPDTSIIAGPTGTISTTVVAFEWTGVDDVTPSANLLFSYKMDADPWSAYTGITSTQFVGLADGAHTFQVRAKDEAENVDPTAASRTFTVDTRSPLITNMSVGSVTATGSTISWNTDEPADSQVEYGPTSAYGSTTPVDLRLVTVHHVALSGLIDSSTYHYRVLSRDEVGNLATSDDHLLYVWPTAPITPTNEWVNFYSQDSTFEGQLLNPGTVIRAFNPRGVQAGHFVVNEPGSYGLMPVYRDDPTTPGDEGMLPGETVLFTIDDVFAHPLGPDAPIWDSNGAVKQVNLAASTVTPTNEWVNFYSYNTVFDDQPVHAGAVIEAYDPQGVKCGEFVVSHAGWYGAMPVYRDDPETPTDEGADPGDTITFYINGYEATPQGPETPEWTTSGDLREVDLIASPPSIGPIISTPSFTPSVASNELLTVTAHISDASTGNNGVAAATLYFGYTTPYSETAIIGTGPGGSGDGLWSFVIPPQGDTREETTLKFYITAADHDTPPGTSTNDNSGSYFPVSITDDDTSPPTFSDNSPTTASDSEIITLQVDISDPSGVYDTASNTSSVYLQWDTDGEFVVDVAGSIDMDLLSGDTYQADETIGLFTSGTVVSWRVYAEDDDNSRTGKWSNTFAVDIGNDDTEGPTIATPSFDSSVASDDPLTVTSTISDASTGNHGVASATLYYGYTSPYNQSQVAGTGPGGNGDGTWSFVIPPEGDSHEYETLKFYIVACDDDDSPACSTNDNSGSYYSVLISDDDTLAPTFSNPSPTSVTDSESITLQVDISDLSGVYDTASNTSSVYLQWDTDGEFALDVAGSIDLDLFSGDTYRADASIGPFPLGTVVSWRVFAQDNDNSKTGAWSSTYVVTIYDDDTESPVIGTPTYDPGVPSDQSPIVTSSISDASTGNHGINSATLYYGYASPFDDYSVIGTGPGGSGDGTWTFSISAQGDSYEYETLKFSIVACDTDDSPACSTNDNSGSYYSILISDDDITAPTFSNPSPISATESETITLSVDISDPSGIYDSPLSTSSVYLQWDTDGEFIVDVVGSIDMDLLSGDTYQADEDIGPFSSGTVVSWRVYADDNDNSKTGAWSETYTAEIGVVPPQFKVYLPLILKNYGP